MDYVVGIIVICVFIFALELAWRKNGKEYKKAEKVNDIVIERQQESLAILKDIRDVLQEISQKLDKKELQI